MTVEIELALAAYAQGLFPMDSEDAQDEPLPFYRAQPRTVLPIDAHGLAALRRRLRRSLARDPGWQPRIDAAFEVVLRSCARPRREDDGTWLTPRMKEMYRGLRARGAAHSFELWEGDELLAGVLGVVLGRAAMLESMFHRRSHAGNVNL